MKKFLALILAAMMLLSLVPAMADSPVEITILLEGNNVTDDAAVLEKLNAYLNEKIGVSIVPTWGTWGNFDQTAQNAVNSGSSEYDILFTCSWTANEYAPYAKKGAYVRLDDPEDDLLAEYGAELKTVLPELRRSRLQGFCHHEHLGRQRHPAREIRLYPGRCGKGRLLRLE